MDLLEIMGNQIDAEIEALKDAVERARQLVEEAKYRLAELSQQQDLPEQSSMDTGAMQANAGSAACPQQG